ncbi:MAG TPA: glucose-1-phosphate cytidylyltransferase [Allosphingosinicella sp.]|nr:glucose-1-phosphate cytidylyltransferase [Allosphingosinicella sp.]
MKVVLLAGGLGSRLSEETQLRPKPMVEIGGHPILWHIMMMYSRHGLRDFIVCLGYRGYFIKEYFANFVLHRSDVTLDLASGSIDYARSEDVPDWRVTLVDTGTDTMTGGRLKRVAHLLRPGEPFCMTYGDGVSDVNISDLVAFHRQQGLAATVTAVQPPGRYGATRIKGNRVVRFEEKPPGDGGRINGGFFVLEPDVLQRIAGDDTSWEDEPLRGLASDGELAAFMHDGFWQPMDTLRDKNQLEALWASGRPPWKTW